MLKCCFSNELIIKNWQWIGEVSELISYPLKSGGPVFLSKIDYSPFTLENNKLRDCMFTIKKDGAFIDEERYPRIVDIQPTYVNNTIILSAPGMIDIAIDISELEETPITECDAWGREVRGINCGYPISRWISKYLQKDNNRYQLYYSSTPMRNREGSEQIPGYKKWRERHQIVRVINESLIDDLNEKLTDIKMKPVQFRPYIVIKGPPAFQLLWTLNRYRKFNNLVDTTGPLTMMGVYGEINETGIIRVGDPVYIPA